MGKWQSNLPAVLNPPGDMCVRVYIPNHPDYIKLFVRAIRMLEVNRMYARDENLSAKIVVEQWRNRTVTPLIEALATGTGLCEDLDGECLAYPPFANFISYFPQNPYTEPDLVPPGFLVPPFYVNGKDAEHTLPNYEPGDVIVNIAAINLEPSWDLDNTPRLELCLEGSGVCEIHFLNIVQGGVAIVSLDNPVDLGDILAGIIGDGIEVIDLNQDIVALPPETTEEIIIEVEVPTEEEHILYIYFLPTVNDSLIPLAFGGGIREISLCGNLRPCGQPAPEPPPPLDGVTELKPEFQFTADCGLEYRLRDQEDEIVQDWQPVPGWVENFADCIGGMGMATKDDIRDGIYEAMNRLALQLASGGYTNISVDEEGNVTAGGDSAAGGEDIPPDDPATPALDEELAAIMGGAISVTRALEKFFDKLDALYGNTNGTPLVVEAATQNIIKSFFPCDAAAMDAAITAYYTYRGQNGVLNFNTTQAIERYMFCRGYDELAFNQWMIDVSGFVYAKQNTMSQLIGGLADEFWSHYFDVGVQVPSQDYQAASCTKVRTETFQLDMSTANAPAYTTSEIWKGGHRFLITCTGSYSDSTGTGETGIVGDGMYFHTTATGVKTFSTLGFNSAGGVVAPTQAQVPFESSHNYSFIVEKTQGSADGSCIISRDNGAMNLPGVTGILTITVEDLGDFSI